MDKSPKSSNNPSLSGPTGSFSRRQFLRSASLGGVAAGATGCFERPATRQFWSKPLKPGGGPRIAIVGCGEQGYALMKAISLIENAEQMPNVRCVVDIDRMKVARVANWGSQEGHDARQYQDLGEMLEKEAANLDAVVIATPDWIHHKQTIQCLRAGLHVYCEKPMSNRIEHAREMVKVARETGRMLEIGYQRRSHPRYLALREGIIAQHKGLGNLSHAYAQWHVGALFTAPLQVREHKRAGELARQHGYASHFEKVNWSLFRRYGLGAMGRGVHLIDLFNFVFQSQPRRISALGGVHYWTPDNPLGHYEMPDKILANFQYDVPPHLSRDGKSRIATASLQLVNTALGPCFESFHGDAASLEISEFQSINKFLRGFSADVRDKDYDRDLEFAQQQLSRTIETGNHARIEYEKLMIHFFKAWQNMLADGLIYRVPPGESWRARRPWQAPGAEGKPPPPYAKTPLEEDDARRGFDSKRQRELVRVDASTDLSEFRLAQGLAMPSHQPHLLNFFAAVQAGDPTRLRCPAEEGFRSCVTALKTLEAVETGQTIEMSPEDYEV